MHVCMVQFEINLYIYLLPITNPNHTYHGYLGDMAWKQAFSHGDTSQMCDYMFVVVNTNHGGEYQNNSK